MKIENQGTGPACSVMVNDSPSLGLQLLGIDSPGGSLNWSYSQIMPGETKTVNASFQVIGCSDLVNLVNASWGCDNNFCQKTYAKGSIKFLPKEPDLDYAFSPSPIVVPYCNKTRVNVSITNIGDGNATHVHLIFSAFNAPYAISNVSGAEYFAENHTFFLGSLLDWQGVSAGGSKNISFDFAMPLLQCNKSGISGLFNVNIHYYDDCRDEWFPPVSQVAYSLDPASVPEITVSKSSNSGKNGLYLGERENYTLIVNYKSGTCQASLPENTIIDRYPASFEVLDAAGGRVDGANHSIIWEDQDLNASIPWIRIVSLRARLQNDCSCGVVLDNELYVSAGKDCCSCPLNASAQLPIIVKCFNRSVLSFSSKTALPSEQENCRLIDYSNTYVFDNSSPLNWSDINFTETGGNAQTFPDGSDTGSASFDINGCSNVSAITINASRNLGFLEAACGPLQKGDVLIINYTLRQPNAGSFVDWSNLCVQGYHSGCAEEGCFHEETSVTVSQADYGIDISGVPSVLSACCIFNLTLNLTKNSPDDDPRWIAHNLSITYNDSNYRYLGPARITGIVNQSGAVQDFEPERLGSDLTWNLGRDVSREGSITFKVQMACPAEMDATARLVYQDNCGALMSRMASSSPSIQTFANIYVEKTPEVIFALDRKASWKIYVTNTGSGPAHNVTVVDDMQAGLNYNGSKISRCKNCPFSEEALNTSIIDVHPCGPDRVIWKIGDMPPKYRAVIEVNASLCGCRNLDNRVYATVGCLGCVCQNKSATSRVELIDAEMLVSKHDAGLVDDCGANDKFSIEVRNAGTVSVYNMSIREELPFGLKLNDTPVVSGAVPSGVNYSIPGILIWHFNDSGISPGTRIAIKFNASVKGACLFQGGDSRVLVNYTEPCGRFGPQLSSVIPISRCQPQLTILKEPASIYASLGDTARWTITLKNTGNCAAKNVTLFDILPANVRWTSAFPQNSSGDGTPADPLLWNLPDIPAGATEIVRLNATVTGCGDAMQNTARIYWSCCPSNASASSRLITRPAVSGSMDANQLGRLSSCGGELTITLSNAAATASLVNITDILPEGFVYLKNSARITSNNATHNATITRHEPKDSTPLNRTVIWDSSNLDAIYGQESITIKFRVINCSNCCRSAISSNNTLRLHYLDSCGSLFSTQPQIQNVLPGKADLRVRKEPAMQFVGPVSWTIYIDNEGTEQAENVSVEDILGDGFYNVSSSSGTVIPHMPSANRTTIKWTIEKVPVGFGTWSAVVTASSNETCGQNHSNIIIVRGVCDTKCLYASSNASARALPVAALELDSIESLLRGQTDLISSFEVLLQNSSLDGQATQGFLASFDDLSARQQAGLDGFNGLVSCNWNDLSSGERMKFTASFEDLLRRQAMMISANEQLLMRGYCLLSAPGEGGILEQLRAAGRERAEASG